MNILQSKDPKIQEMIGILKANGCPQEGLKQALLECLAEEKLEVSSKKIIKEVFLTLTEEEINSPKPIEIKFHVHSETDPKNEEGVTYTINFPKK